MPTAPTEFTLNADVFRIIADTADVGADADILAITGLELYFDPDVDDDHLLVASITPRPIFLKPERFTGYIRSNGRMYDQPAVSVPPADITDPGNLGLRMLASGAELNLADPPLTYAVSSNQVVIGGSLWGIVPWHIPAPTTDTVVDLAALAPTSANSGDMILRGPPGAGVDAVRLSGGNIIFSYLGVDLPVPLAFTPASVPDGSVTTIKIVDANVTLAKLSGGVTTSLARADTAVQIGGDLSGSNTAPNVAKVNGVAVTGTPTVGQVPTATSGSAATWQTPAGGVLTTAGDIIVRNATVPARHGVGTNGQVLRVNTANADKLEYATLAKADVGLGNVDNTADAAKNVAAVGGVTITGTPTAGQLPTATSGSAATWQTPVSTTSIMTTPGDIIVRDTTVPVRKPIGTNTQVLRVNTANTDKTEWATLTKTDVGLANVDNTSDVNKPVSTAQATADALKISNSLLTTKGDMIAAASASAPTRLPVGADAQVLTADSTQTLGVKWANVAGGYTDPLTTAGDLVVRGASASIRKAVGTNAQVLRVNTANADKLEYATLAKADVGLANVDNTSDVNKPVSILQAAADTAATAAALAAATGRAVAFALVF